MTDFRSSFHYFGANSGACVSYTDPQPEQINFRDIALSLSRQCRGLGHDKASIAQHCLVTTFLMFDLNQRLSAPDQAASLFLALLHDAHEAYTGDIPMPLKTTLRDMWKGSIQETTQFAPAISDPIKIIETKLDQAIWRVFDLAPPTEEIRTFVNQCDKMAIALEMRDVMSSHRRQTFLDSGYSFLNPREDVSITILPSVQAEKAFMEGIELLTKLKDATNSAQHIRTLRPTFCKLAGLVQKTEL